MKTKVQKWGNSLAIRIPQALAKKYRLDSGSDLTMSDTGKGLNLKVENKSKYKLSELLAKITPQNLNIDREWLDMKSLPEKLPPPYEKPKN